MNRLLLLAVLVAPAARAQEPDRSHEIPMEAPRPFKPAPIEESSLSNGIKIAVVQSHRVALATLELLLPLAGSAFDPKDRAGVASFVSTLLTEGTASRTSEVLAKAIDDLGGGVSVSVSRDAMSVTVFVLKEQLEPALALMADIVRHPAFPAEQLERVRQETLAALQQQKADPEALAKTRLARAVFGDGPYGRQSAEDTVKAIQRDDLVAFHDQRFSPQGAIIAAAGDLTLEETKALAEKYFGDWTAPKTEAPIAHFDAKAMALPPETTLAIDLIDRPGSEHSEILAGELTISRESPDRLAVLVMNHILGGDPIMGRLSANLREEKQWAYGAGSSLQLHRAAGLFAAGASVQADKTGPALTEILKELRRIQDETVPAEELQTAKLNLLGSLLRGQQHIQNLEGQVSIIELYGLPKDSLSQLKDGLMTVSAADVQRVAKAYLHADKLHVVIVGDAAKVYKQLTPIAPVQVLDLDGKPKPAPTDAAAPVS